MRNDGPGALSPDYRVWPKTGALVVIASSALVPDETVIWHFATILGWVRIGTNVSIGAMSEIGRSTQIGDGSRISRGVFLPSHSFVGSNVFIGPNVSCSDDRYPRIPEPGDPPYHAEPPIIEDGASIGIGAILLPGVRIGARSLVGAGAVVTEDVPPDSLYVGLPARNVGSVDHHRPVRAPNVVLSSPLSSPTGTPT